MRARVAVAPEIRIVLAPSLCLGVCRVRVVDIVSGVYGGGEKMMKNMV